MFASGELLLTFSMHDAQHVPKSMHTEVFALTLDTQLL